MLKNQTNQLKRPPRLGKVKVGEKAEEGYPKGVDYFIIDSDYKDKVLAKYGEKPKLLNIVFPYDDIEDNLNEMYRMYGKSGLKCIGDGETANKADIDGKMTEQIDCPCHFANPPEGQKVQCYPTMIMSFIITGIGVTGVWTFSSKAVFSRSNVRSIMEMVQTTTGKLAGVPFYLRVDMQESTIANNPHKFPVVSIDCAMDLEDLMKQNLQLSKPEKLKELKPPVTSDVEQKQEETEQKTKFSPAVQKEWDVFHKWLEDNKDKLKQGTYDPAMIWLKGLEKPTVEKLLKNLALIKSQIVSDAPTGEYKQYHESLITACCDTLKSKDRLPVIQTLTNIVKKWGIEGLDKLSETTENQCIDLLAAFDQQLKDDDEADLPF